MPWCQLQVCKPLGQFLYGMLNHPNGTLRAGIFSFYTIHAIFILRLYGLYGSKRMVYSLSSLLVLTLLAEIYVAVQLLPHFSAVATDPSIGSVCVSGTGHQFAFVWYALHTV